jgi:hypothetical protein
MQENPLSCYLARSRPSLGCLGRETLGRLGHKARLDLAGKLSNGATDFNSFACYGLFSLEYVTLNRHGMQHFHLLPCRNRYGPRARRTGLEPA